MHKGKRGAVCLALVMGLVLGMSGCGSAGSESMPDLSGLGEITACTREKASGTRASFDDLLGLDSESESLTVAVSTEEMASKVGESEGAIGYLTKEAAGEGLKTLTINGKAVDDSKYPLTRKLYLAYQDNLSDLGKEFVTYATGKGQEIVGKSFETVGSAGTFLSLKPSGTLTIGGSSSEAPVMEELAKAYMEINPNARITVETTDSGDGINGAMQGTYQLGMSSREPKDYEKSLLTFTAVAKDRIAVVVPEANPLTDITVEKLRNIYSGSYTNWTDLTKG